MTECRPKHKGGKSTTSAITKMLKAAPLCKMYHFKLRYSFILLHSSVTVSQQSEDIYCESRFHGHKGIKLSIEKTDISAI